MYACNGILFNHESPRRGETFVTRKITRGLARIDAGLEECLFMGNLDRSARLGTRSGLRGNAMAHVATREGRGLCDRNRPPGIGATFYRTRCQFFWVGAQYSGKVKD